MTKNLPLFMTGSVLAKDRISKSLPLVIFVHLINTEDKTESNFMCVCVCARSIS